MKKFKNDFPGVYQFKNIINGKVYIGSSINVLVREYRHRSDLNSKTRSHHTIHFQRAWDEYGEDNFMFSVLEGVSFKKIETPEDKKELGQILETREQYYMDLTKCYDPKFGYNTEPKASSSAGRVTSDETKEKLRIAGLGRKESDETRLKKKIIATGNPNYSHQHLTGGNSTLAIKVLQYNLDGNFFKVWDSISDVVRHYNLATHSNIVTCCNEKLNTAHEYMWKYHTLNYPLSIDPAIKRGETFKNVYGVGTDKHEETLKKRRDTSNELYGKTHHMKTAAYKKFGDLNPMKDAGIREKVGKSGSNTKALKLVVSLFPAEHIFKGLIGDEYTIECPLCRHNFQIGRPLLHHRKREGKTVCTECNPLKKNQYK